MFAAAQLDMSLERKLHFTQNFIRHYLTATRIDVLHSPFVYNLYQTCIRNRANKDYMRIEQLRASLKNNQQPISFEDFGASKYSRNTTVAALASQHLKPARIAQILHRMAQHYQYKTIVELGTSLGVTTSYLAIGAHEHAHIHTIEACEPVLQQARLGFDALGVSTKIQPYSGTFDAVLPELLPKLETIDLLFIDGNHSYDATLRYFEWCLPKLNNNSVIVFDDIYWSKEMTAAWQKIKGDKRITVSVDLFFIGLAYIRKEQVKEHFKLRVC